MLRSKRPNRPRVPRKAQSHYPPNSHDRYIPTDVLQLHFRDIEGRKVVVVLSRKAAHKLIYSLYRSLSCLSAEGVVC